jgi:hypothetical protein
MQFATWCSAAGVVLLLSLLPLVAEQLLHADKPHSNQHQQSLLHTARSAKRRTQHEHLPIQKTPRWSPSPNNSIGGQGGGICLQQVLL